MSTRPRFLPTTRTRRAHYLDDALLVVWQYHHISVMIYCWHSYGVRSSNSSWFVGMNYCVHAVMYFYYFLTSIGIRPSWGKSVTYLQLSQMVVGIAVQTATYFYVIEKHGTGKTCDVDPINIQAGFAMYFSYFLLFLKILLFKDYSHAKKKPDAARDAPPDGVHGVSKGRKGD